MDARWRPSRAAALLAAIAFGASSAQPARAAFTDVTVAAGVAYQQHDPGDPFQCLIDPSQLPCDIEWLSGGGTTADVDGDGWPDLYVTRLHAPDILFRNRGDGTFEDVTAAAGLAAFDLQSNGANFVDVDNDGDLDLYVLGFGIATDPANGRFHLFINDGSGSFTEEAIVRGADVASSEHRAGYSVAVGDYDRDGWIDLYTTEWRQTYATLGFPTHSRLLRNLGSTAPGYFEDVTLAAGVVIDRDPRCLAGTAGCTSRGYAPAFVDLDGDHWLDLAIASDFGTSVLFWNDGDGTFTEGTVAAGVGIDENGMGSTFGDFDGDGDLDWFVTSIFDPVVDSCLPFGFECSWGALGNRLYRNEGGRLFSDVTDAIGVADGYWGWGAAFLDYDNDADLDLVMTNGAHFGFVGPPIDSIFARFDPDPMRLWRNDGPGPMAEVSTAEGLTDEGAGKGLLTFDYDGDGDLDVFVVNHTTGGLLYRNDAATGNAWLRVKVSSAVGFEPDGIGAVVTLEAADGGPSQVRHIGASSHFLGESERIAHFGLGDHVGPIHRVTVEWPGRGTVVYDSLAPNQTFVAVETGWIDTDADGLADADEIALGTDPEDADSDDDGLRDGFEVGLVGSPRDTDGDTLIDALDSDDDGDGIPTAAEDANGNGNPADDDADGDGIPDYRESDSENDGVPDATDNCRTVANASQSDVNGDGIGDACQPGDTDQDGWPNVTDNCVVVQNPLQEDTDEDGIGDACTYTSTAARQWNEELLGAIRRDLARPTIHARNLFHVSAAMWDAWAAYDAEAQQVLHAESATAGDVPAARAKAISFAAYRVLRHRFASSPGAAFSMVSFDERMRLLGYDKSFVATVGDVDPPAELGNRIAASVIAFGLADGSNEQGGYANQFYQPVNPPLLMALPGNPDMVDLNRWQPLALNFFIDQSGNPIPGGFPPFLSPEWGQVVPFALSTDDVTIHHRGGFDYWVYHDPGPPHLLGTPTAEDYLDSFEMVVLWSSHLDPSDGVLWDVSPAGQGNAPLPDTDEWRDFYDFEGGGDWGTGYPVNPVTGVPYVQQIVPRGDYARALAEYWADGPASETPPGHWFTVANYVSDNLVEKRIGPHGAPIDDLEWDVKLYLTLGGTLHDVAVSVWGMKGWYDYTRPVSALRAMAEKGQRSDPGAPSYHPEGFELRPGFIELITPESSAPGERHEHLAAFVDEVAIRAWRGPDYIEVPATDVAGVGWIRAKEWWPYQRPSFVTPPFAGFPSGHSAFSRAAATVLHQLSGTPYFPNGLGEFHAPQNEFLVFEDGPSVDMTLQYASFYDASDQTSLSRIWGGIHPPVDDLASRHIGAAIAVDGVAHALSLFDGPQTDGDADEVPDAIDNCSLDANTNQADADGDGTGNLCDDLCVGTVTTLTGVTPRTVRKGQTVKLFGTGFGPSARVRIGPAEQPLQFIQPFWIALIPTGRALAPGVHPIAVVNPEGCQSQEPLTVTIQGPQSCGFTGIEPFLLFGLLGLRRLGALVRFA